MLFYIVFHKETWVIWMQRWGYFKLYFIIKNSNLDINLGVVLNYLYLVPRFGNLDINLGGYFEIFLIMAEVGNLDGSSWVILKYLS